MKLTKTENIVVYKIVDGFSFEFIAGKSLGDVQQYVIETYGDIQSHTFTKLNSAALKKELGLKDLDKKAKGQISALTALKQQYKISQLPFVFWVSDL